MPGVSTSREMFGGGPPPDCSRVVKGSSLGSPCAYFRLSGLLKRPFGVSEAVSYFSFHLNSLTYHTDGRQRATAIGGHGGSTRSIPTKTAIIGGDFWIRPNLPPLVAPGRDRGGN